MGADLKGIDAKKQISFADKDARIMGKKGSFDYGYNGQISVDKDHQIIVGQHISQNGNDKQEVQPALESVVASTGQQAQKMSLDNGYMSAHNLEALEATGIDAYIATDRAEKSGKSGLDESDRKLVKADFKYNESEDHFTCPGGQTLRLIKGRQEKRVYQGDASVCAVCPYKTRCCQSDKGEARTISTDDKEPLRQRMNKKMDQETSKEIYGHRKVIVEPVFGHIKNSEFRGFSVRGQSAVAGEFSLVCAVHNVKKMIRAAMAGQVRPDFEKEGKMAA
jgi:transposase